MKKITKLFAALSMPLILCSCTPKSAETAYVTFKFDQGVEVYYSENDSFAAEDLKLIATSENSYPVLNEKGKVTDCGTFRFAVKFKEGFEAEDEIPDIDGILGTNYSSYGLADYEGEPGFKYYTIEDAKGHLTVSVKSKAVHVNSEEDGYKVTFRTSHCKVYVYATQDYANEEPVEKSVTASRNADTGEYAKYVAGDVDAGIAEVKPQVNFKVVADDGYYVSIDDIQITGTKGVEWNNIKSQGADIYRITVIKDEIGVIVDAKTSQAEDDPANGHAITFVNTHCKVLVYMSQNYAEETPVEMTSTASRDVDAGKYAKYVAADADAGIAEVKPQVNFKVVADDGYVVSIDNITVSGTKGEEYNKFQLADATLGVYKITKIKADLTITITAVAA